MSAALVVVLPGGPVDVAVGAGAAVHALPDDVPEDGGRPPTPRPIRNGIPERCKALMQNL